MVGRQHAAETAVKLARDDEDEPWRYTGPWFAIESTANPRLTRQAVVRLEQVFMSLEALLPTPEGPVKRQPNKSPTPLRVAYADLQLTGPTRQRLPLWLDEGLAQVFERAPLEVGEMRLDAPDPARLRALPELLSGGKTPRLIDLLQAGQAAGQEAKQQQFLVGHTGGKRLAGRAIEWPGGSRLISRSSTSDSRPPHWQRSVNLPLTNPPSTADRLRQQGSRAGAQRVAEFEQLVGETVAAFEASWRRRIAAAR